MSKTTMLAGAIWAFIVGGNIVDVLTISPQVFVGVPQLPWEIVFMPLVVVVGAFVRPYVPTRSAFGDQVDRRFGQGAHSKFMEALKPELMLAVMCFCIVLSGLARAFFFNTTVLPPAVLGFFAGGVPAFLVAYYIRRRRENAQ